MSESINAVLYGSGNISKNVRTEPDNRLSTVSSDISSISSNVNPTFNFLSIVERTDLLLRFEKHIVQDVFRLCFVAHFLNDEREKRLLERLIKMLKVAAMFRLHYFTVSFDLIV